jgi:hypothetical protein
VSTTTTAREGREESDMDFGTIPAGCLEEGTETTLGIIEHVSLTAYLIDGRWVPFHRIHGRPARAESFAGLQHAVDMLTDDMADAMRAQSDRNIARMLGR